MTTALTAKVTQAVEVHNYFNLVDRWIAYAQVSKSSVKSYKKGIRRFMEYCAANAIKQPTRDTLIEYREYLKGKYAAASANLYLTSAKLFFSFLQVEGIIPNNPAERVKGLKVQAGHKKDALSSDAVKKILATFDTSTLKGKRDKAMFALMVTAGLRTIEVSRADKADIIQQAGKYFLLVQGKGHNEKDAMVKISDGVFALIQDYLASRADDSANLFGSASRRNKGGRMTTNSISRIVKSAMKGAGYDSKRLTAHSLRHTAATVALKAGASLREVQQVLRHTSITVTQVYLHDLDRLNNKAEELNAAAFGL